MKKKHSFSFKMMARTFVVSLLIITLVISSVPTTGIFGNQVRGAYARETSGKALSASTGKICPRYTVPLDLSQLTESTNSVTKDNHSHAEGEECWSWDNTTKTLTINGLFIDVKNGTALAIPGSTGETVTINIQGAQSSIYSVGKILTTEANLVVKGAGTLMSSSTSKTDVAVDVAGDLTVGGKTLFYIATNAYQAINVGKNLTAKEMGSIDARGDISVGGSLEVNGGSILVQGGKTNAEGKDDAIINVVGSTTVVSGRISADYGHNRANSTILETGSTFTMNGGTVALGAGPIGLFAADEIKILGGTFNADGTNAALFSNKLITVGEKATILAANVVNGTLEAAKVFSAYAPEGEIIASSVVLSSTDDAETDPILAKKVSIIFPKIITFDARNGSAVTEIVVAYGTITMPANPTLDGYEFAGWYYAANGLYTTAFANYNLTENVTVYAKWTLNGQIANTQKYTTGLDLSAVTADADCSKDGHIHAVEKCWSWNNTTKTLTINELDINAKNETALTIPGSTTDTVFLVLKGNNKINTDNARILSIDGNLTISGTGSLTASGDSSTTNELVRVGKMLTMESGTVTVTDRTTQKRAISCEDIIINGGTLEANGENSSTVLDNSGTLEVNGGTLKVTGGTNTVYAIYQRGNITINGGTIDVSGAQNGIGSPYAYLFYKNGKIIASGSNIAIGIKSLHEVNPDATIMASDTVDGTLVPSEIVKVGDIYRIAVGGNVEVGAKSVEMFVLPAITFDQRNGSAAIKAVINEETKKITMPADPTYDGYVFAGWYTGIDGTGTTFVNENLVSATVYAKWTLNGQIANTQKYTTGLDVSNITTDASCVTKDNHAHIAGNECWNLNWINNKKTLTINDLNIDAPAGVGLRIHGVNADSATLILKGDNKISAVAGYAIFANCNLTIEGDGSLTMNGSDKTNKVAAFVYSLIMNGGTVNVTEKGSTGNVFLITAHLIINDGTLNVIGSGENDKAINLTGYLEMNGGTLNVNGAKKGISSSNNQLTYNGGKIIASGSDYALEFFKSIVNPDATIMASDTVDGTLEEAKVSLGNKIVLVRDEALAVKSVEMYVIPTITIKALNGNLDVKEVIAENGKITMPAKPTLNGYVFAGWYNATNGLYTTEFKNENLTKSATVYAKWTLNGQIANTQKYTTGLDFSAVTADADCSRDGHIHAVEKCWSWNNATRTLTINDLNIDAPTGHAIKVGPDGSTENLVINGNNKINTGNGSVVYALGNLIISGTGSLTATGENTSIKFLMYVSKLLSMNSGTVSLTGNGALTTVIGCSQIDIYGGTLEATGLNTQNVINVSSIGNVNIYGGTIKATGGADSTAALLASKTIEVKGGTLDVSGAKIGIQCKKLTVANNGKRLIASGSVKAIDITDLTATGLISFGGLSIKASATDGVTFESGMVSTDGKNVVLVGDSTAIAKYVKASIASIITFDARGGHQDATATVDVDTNMITTMPENPTYGAYVFGGWYTGIDGTGTKFENKNLTDSATVYAKWTSADGQIANTQKYDNGLDLSALTADADCSKDGHVHAGKKCWVWDDAKKTLELNNATTNNNTDGGAGLILPGTADDDVTLILNGSNDVFGKNAPALKTNANLTITGDGELSALGDTAIDVAGDLTVKDKSRVFASGKYPAIKVGKDMLVEKNGSIDTYAGIIIDGALTVNGGDLVVSGNSDKLENKDSVIKVVGSIIINGGKVNVRFNKSAKGYGIYTDSTFTITGGNVNIEGREAAYNTGILTDKEFVMSGGTITVAGTNKDSFASIYSNSKVTITGGTLDLSGSEAGLCAFDVINISGGKTSVKGTDNAIMSNKPIIVDAKGAIKASNTVDGTLESAKVFHLINSENEIIASYIVLSSTDDTIEEPDSAKYVQIVFKSSSKDDSFEIIDTSPNTSVVVPPLAGGENAPTTVEAKVDATVDGDGNVNVDVTDKIMRDAIDSAIKEANKNGNTKNGIFVIIRVSTNGGNESKISVNLPKTVQERVINGNVLNTVVIVDRPDITINMDINTIKEINKQANSDVKLSAERIANSSLSGEAKEAISTRPVFDLEATFGVGSKVSDFGLGQVAVGIPYVLQAGEKAENVRAVYVNAIGKVEWLKDSYYDVETSTVMFNSNHFSIYGVGYQEITTGPIDPTNPVDPTTPTAPTANYTWLWILIAVIVIGGGVTFYIIKKKKNETK